jgi:hypothetical protein
MTYSEHEKLHKIKDESQACGEFLEWLLGAQRYTLGEYHTHTEACGEYERGAGRPCGLSENTLYPVAFRIEKLLAMFFEIDPEKIEDEKRAMLKEYRSRKHPADLK